MIGLTLGDPGAGGAAAKAARKAARGFLPAVALGLLPLWTCVTPAQETTTIVTNTLSSFRIKPGFRIELVAAEPMVAAPAAMAFDENGRLLVAELRDYPDRRAVTPHEGRIRVLESSRQDGVYDVSSVYAENLAWPSALACWQGGVFVATTPEVLYVKAPQPDGTNEIRKTIASGFGPGAPAPEPLLLNSFNWGLDNRIYGAAAGAGGSVASPSAPGYGPVTMYGRDFAFDPQTLAMEPVGGSVQSGLCFDSRGRRFGCDFDRPLRLVLWEPQYRARNPFFAKPAALWDAARPATVVYRFSPAPTRLPAAPQNRPGAILSSQAAPLVPGWMTKARGCAVYRGGAFPPGYLDNVFIPDSDAHLLHHVWLNWGGLTPSAERAVDEPEQEFLVSRDPAFQPVQVINGPEGGLYIADFHGGGNQGRIYRILPAGFKPPKQARLGLATTYDLVLALAHADGWRSDTAARLLYEQRDPAAVPLLDTTFHNARDPLVRLRALYALAGLGAVTETHLLFGMQDLDERVRQHAVRLSEPLLRSDAFANVFWDQLERCASDASPQVRYQLALSLGECRRPGKVRLLARLAQTDAADPWMRAAVLSSSADGAGELFTLLARPAAFRNAPAGQECLRQLVQTIGLKGRLPEVNQTIDFLDRTELETGLTLQLLYDLGSGLKRLGSSLALVDPQIRLRRFYENAAAGMVNDLATEPLRLAAMNLMQVSPYGSTNVEDLCLVLLGSGQSAEVQAAGIRVLGQCDTPRTATNLLARWPVLTPALRRTAVASLLERASRIPTVLSALERGAIQISEVPAAQINFLRFHPDPALRERALRLFGPLATRRPGPLESFQPAIGMGGNASRGRRLFGARCAACHQPGADGIAVGPTLAGARTRGREALLEAIVEPNAEVRPGYEACVLETQNGEYHLGVLDDENPTTITLRQPGGQATVWPRSAQWALRPQAWSLMPDDLTRDCSVQDLADLLDYLMTGAE